MITFGGCAATRSFTPSGFAASARRNEPEWRAHCGEAQRSDCRKDQVRAAPAGKCGRRICLERQMSAIPCETKVAGHFPATS